MHEINNIMNDKWKTEIVDSSFVLGVKRQLVTDSDGWHITMSMKQYMLDMETAFHDDLM